MGLPDKAEAYPAQLSGGQQQRIAIARALATNPKVLLCDEATSALDPKTTRQILELIQDINRKLGITVVVITHQMSVVKEICTQVAILDDGEVVEDGLVSAVFSAPKSQAARHLVFPGGADAAVSDPSQERRIRLIFRGAQTTAIPMVARLAAEESIYCQRHLRQHPEAVGGGLRQYAAGHPQRASLTGPGSFSGPSPICRQRR